MSHPGLKSRWAFGAAALLLLACSKNENTSGSGGNTSSGGANPGSGGSNTGTGGSSTSNGGSGNGTGGSATGSGGSNNANGGSSNANGGASSTTNGGMSTSNGGASNGGASTSKGGGSNGGSTNGGSGAGKGGSSNGGTTSGSGGATAMAGSTGKAEVRFVGRVDKSDSAGPRFAWSGSGVVASFQGTQVSVKLSSGQFTVLVDGTQKTKLVANGSMASLATGLAAGAHTVELYRRTEANQGETQFLGFDFGGGQLLAPPAAPTRRIEIVGDSITCGYGNEGADMNCPFSAETENHYLSYGAIAARNVNAELVSISWSGKGIVCNYGDDTTSCMNPLPTYYERALPDRSTSQWDFSSWQADAVIINLGTNDLSTNVDPTQSEFVTGYKGLVTKIRSKYPNAYILLTNGSMLSGNDLTTVRGYLNDVVTQMNDSKVKSFEIAPQLASDGYGCDWHPSLATHRKMADQVTAVLKSTLGW